LNRAKSTIQKKRNKKNKGL